MRVQLASRVLAAAALGGGALLALWPAPAGADVAPDKAGWWSEVQQSAPATLPVSTATGTNLVVGNDPNGADNVAAVQYTVPQGTDPSTAAGTLTLTIAPNTSAGTVQLAACPIAGDWQPVDGGAWADKPNWSCASSATGTVSADGTTVSFPLTPAVQSSSGVFSLAIVPAAGAGPFQVQFTAPAASSLTLSGGSSATGTDTTSAPSPDTTPSPDTASVPDASAGSASVSQAVLPAVTSAGQLPVETPAAAPAPAAAAPAATAPASGSGPATPALAAPAASHRASPSSERAHRIMALALLGVLAGGMWWLGGSAARQPHLLGSLGGPSPAQAGAGGGSVGGRMGGIGRFARPRHQPPRRLG